MNAPLSTEPVSLLEPDELEYCIEHLIPLVRRWGTGGIEEAVKEMDRRVAAGEEEYVF